MTITRAILISCAVLLLAATAAVAGGPAVSPFESNPVGPASKGMIPMNKDLGTPADLAAAALAGGDYLRYMQADVTEDNAGNGEIDDLDPDDAGWDWETNVFYHSASGSPLNIYGATAAGLIPAWRLSGDAALWQAMQDAADHMVSVGPSAIRSAADMVFLLDFAALPGVADPSVYRDAARAIWTYRLANYGDGTGTGFAEYILYARGGVDGTAYWANGIIPWDIAPYCEAVMELDALYPGNGYAADAVEMAEVLYQDGYMANPGFFEPEGHSKGYTTDYSETAYFFYGGGVSGLIRAFATTGTHLDKLPGLTSLMLECQYADGAFSYQYGAATEINDRDWQVTAYCVKAIYENLDPAPATDMALGAAGGWLAATQDASGGFVYSDGYHYPEVGGECTAAVGMAAQYAGISCTVDGPDPVLCGVTKTVTVAYEPGEPVVGLRGYEITFAVTGPVTVGTIADAGALAALGLHYYHVVDNGDGTYTVSDALLGTTTGLATGANLFTVPLLTTGDGPVALEILGYKLRDPANAPLYAYFSGVGFTVDCTAPDPVTGITAEPGHEKVDVSWSMADESDVAYYEVWRGLWYDTTTGNSAYPEYDDLAGDVIPTRPADRAAAFASAEWELADTVPVGTLTYADDGMAAGRGVYYYEVFPVDVPGNIGGSAAANDRATNYWLGDFSGYDGLVDGGDITVLGATFGYMDGHGGYNDEADVGPTDDWSGTGIPLTDSVIDFEDLMVVAMNYGNVSKLTPAAVMGPAVLAWHELEPGTWSLVLAEPCAALKGVRVTAALPAGVSCTLVGGDVLAGQPGPVFLRNIDANGLDANLAVIGSGTGIDGSGELLRVTLSEPVNLGRAGIKARGLDNRDLQQQSGSVPASGLNVAPNFPNPFNPSTTIAFELPVSGRARLSVYAVDGSLVRILADRVMAAGPQTVVWDGRTDAGSTTASGTYFLRVEAAGSTVVRKMQLVK